MAITSIAPRKCKRIKHLLAGELVGRTCKFCDSLLKSLGNLTVCQCIVLVEIPLEQGCCTGRTYSREKAQLGQYQESRD